MKNKILFYLARIVFTVGIMIWILTGVRSCINATGGW